MDAVNIQETSEKSMLITTYIERMNQTYAALLSRYSLFLDLDRAPYCYVLYAVEYIDLVSLDALCRHAAFLPRYRPFQPHLLLLWGRFRTQGGFFHKNT